jgi:tetratricopeptide (TPR) repeat protein
MAEFCELIGNLNKAETYYLDAKSIYEKQGDIRRLVECHRDLTRVKSRNSRMQEALELAETAVELSKDKHAGWQEPIDSRLSLASLQMDLGKLQHAERLTKEAEDLAKATGFESMSYARTLILRGETLYEMADRTLAGDYLRSGVEMMDRISSEPNPEVAAARLRYGIHLMIHLDPVDARPYLEDARREFSLLSPGGSQREKRARELLAYCELLIGNDDAVSDLLNDGDDTPVPVRLFRNLGIKVHFSDNGMTMQFDRPQ